MPGPHVVRETGSAQEIREFVRLSGMTMLSFVGHSGAGYKDEAAMRTQADRVLERHDPARTMVNIGATAKGIGAVYDPARQRGGFTLGIVSSLAREAGASLSRCVDAVFFVRGKARAQGQAEPVDFRGAAQAAFAATH